MFGNLVFKFHKILEKINHHLPRHVMFDFLGVVWIKALGDQTNM